MFFSIKFDKLSNHRNSVQPPQISRTIWMNKNCVQSFFSVHRPETDRKGVKKATELSMLLRKLVWTVKALH